MKIVVLALSLSIAPFCAAVAQVVPPSGASSMARPGVTGVGLADFQTRRRAQLMRADTDHDGRVSLAEWGALRAAHPGRGGGQGDPARLFQRLDASHDGYLTSDEIDAFTARRFGRADANNDGRLTPDERSSLAQGSREPTQPLNP